MATLEHLGKTLNYTMINMEEEFITDAPDDFTPFRVVVDKFSNLDTHEQLDFIGEVSDIILEMVNNEPENKLHQYYAIGQTPNENGSWTLRYSAGIILEDEEGTEL